MSQSATLPQSNVGWKHFPHDVNVGVQRWGPTSAQAFEQAACAVTAVITHEEARAHNERTANYLLGTPLLGDFLEEGLSLLGRSCEGVQIDRL